MKKYNIVSIGGGTGQAVILKALKKYPNLSLSAIVAITDSGRHSGIVRKELNIFAPGDVRNCLSALALDNSFLSKLFEYRFLTGKTLEGTSIGNLLIAAALKLEKNAGRAITQISHLLGIRGTVIPASFTNVHLSAETKKGGKIEGECNIRKLKNTTIKRVFLQNKTAAANPQAVQAIARADFIVIGPGSLYTSLISNLLFKDIKKALVQSSAQKIYISNLLTQPGQTDGFSGEQHIEELIKYLGDNVLDYAIINNRDLPLPLKKYYKKEKATQVKIDCAALKKMNIIPVYAPLIPSHITKKYEWDKRHLLTHDLKKTGELLYGLFTKMKYKKSKRDA